MIITYYGRQHFKLQVGDTTFAINPVSKEGSGKVAKYGSDVCLVTTNHPDYNGEEQVTLGSKVPLIIKGAGEYEVAGIFIKGFATEVELSEGKKAKKKYQNTSYCFTFDGIRVTFLGALHEPLKPEHKEIIDETDILFIPVGGDDTTLNPYDAHKLSVSLEPKLVIPMDYTEQTLPIFMKEAGEKVEPVEKLTIKKKDIEGKLGEIVLFHEM
ncbi:MAG: hypothetical protein QG653_713 [Patescibacteria group bacterium]|nr:hypothetical protein [Patescibacteria group bacterium]